MTAQSLSQCADGLGTQRKMHRASNEPAGRPMTTPSTSSTDPCGADAIDSDTHDL